MLLDSIDHAEDDIQARLVREQRVEAERILADAEKQLGQHRELLSDEELAAMRSGMSKVAEIAKANDHIAIKAAIMELDELSKPFVERVMNKAIKSALAGHSVEEY